MNCRKILKFHKFFIFFSYSQIESSENVTSTLDKMQATIGTLSRIFSRSLISGVVDRVDTISSYKVSSKEIDSHPQLTTAVSGFPKAKNGQYNIDNILKGQIGDDAYFIARHVDDWNNNNSDTTPGQLLNPSECYTVWKVKNLQTWTG